MFNGDLDTKLAKIVESVKSGASLHKEASEVTSKVNESLQRSKEISSPVASSLYKLASSIRSSLDRITYDDVYSVLSGVSSEGTQVSEEDSLSKVAKILRSEGFEGTQEKVASIMNAATGLYLLREKIKTA
jgi:hypothetical protein